MLQAASPLDGAEQAVFGLRCATALFDSIVRQGPRSGAVMLLRPLSHPGDAFVQKAMPQYSLEPFDVSTVHLGEMDGFQVIHHNGVAAWPLLEQENGVWLVYGEDDELAAIQTIVRPLSSQDDPRVVAAECIKTWRRWRRGLADDPSLAEHNPLKPGPLLRALSFQTGGLDARTGLVLPRRLTEDDYVAILAAALPDAVEFSANRRNSDDAPRGSQADE